MIKDAEKETGPVWADKNNDFRLTKTGKFIRKYAIDEIPQLINIFKIHMLKQLRFFVSRQTSCTAASKIGAHRYH